MPPVAVGAWLSSMVAREARRLPLPATAGVAVSFAGVGFVGIGLCGGARHKRTGRIVENPEHALWLQSIRLQTALLSGIRLAAREAGKPAL